MMTAKPRELANELETLRKLDARAGIGSMCADNIDAIIAALAAPSERAAVPGVERDKQLLDWLEEQIVSEIYLDDGRLIDVKGNSVRSAILALIEQPARGTE
jgi:hypothetical protein